MNTTAPAAPELPVILATSMVYAQGYEATPEDRTAIKAFADWKRNLLDITGPQEISLRVVDSRSPSTLIGWLTFTA